MDRLEQQAVRQLRIVQISVCLGVVAFLGVAIAMQGRLAASQIPENVLVGALAVCALGCGVAYVGVERRAVARVGEVRYESQQESEASAIVAYRQVAIVSAGLIEGPSFLACVAYMLSGSRVAVGAVVIGVLLLLSRMPSEEKLREFVERACGA